MSLTEYLNETRQELNHVAWPTRTQTIVYTILVALISVGVALYLGLFDYIFTGALGRVVGNIAPTAIQPVSTSSITVSTSTITTTPVAPVTPKVPEKNILDALPGGAKK